MSIIFYDNRGVFNPGQLSGLSAWYDFTNSMFLTLSSSAITQALDRSGNGNNTAVQGNATFRPTYTLNRINGLPDAVFDGGDNLLLSSSLFGITNGSNTIFAVAKRSIESSAANVVTSAVQIGVTRTLQVTYSATTGSAIYRNNATNSDVTFTGATNTNYQVLVGHHSGVTQGINVNSGTEITNNSGANTNITNGWQIGASNGGTFLTGDIAEMLIYNRSLSQAEISQITQYFYNKYNLPFINPWVTWDGSKDGPLALIANSSDVLDAVKFDIDRSLILYIDAISGATSAVVATTAGTSITYHTSQLVDIAAMFSASVCALDTNRVLVCYTTVGGILSVVLSIDSSNNITVNSSTVIAGFGTASGLRVLKLSTDQCILVYLDAGSPGALNATCITITGTSVDAPHAILAIENTYVPVKFNITILSLTSIFVTYNSDDAGNGIQGIQLTIVSNIVSKFSTHNLVSSSILVPNLLTCQAIDATHIVIVYEDYNAAVCKAFVVTITDSAGNMSTGSASIFYNGNALGNGGLSQNPLCFIDNATMMIFFTSTVGLACVLSINGNIINPNNVITLYNEVCNEQFGILLDSNRILSEVEIFSGGINTQVLSII